MMSGLPHTQSQQIGNALFHSQSMNSLNDQEDHFRHDQDRHESNSSRYLNLNADREHQYLLLRQEQEQQRQQLQLQQHQQQHQQQQLQMRRLQVQGLPQSASLTSTPFPYYQNQNINQSNNQNQIQGNINNLNHDHKTNNNSNSNDNNKDINGKIVFNDNDFHQISFPNHSHNVPKNIFGSPQRDREMIPQRDKEMILQRDREMITQREREMIAQRDREMIPQREREMIQKSPPTFSSLLPSNPDNYDEKNKTHMNFLLSSNGTNIDDEENKNNYGKINGTKSSLLDLNDGRNGFDINHRNNRKNDLDFNLAGYRELDEDVHERIANQMTNFPFRVGAEKCTDLGSTVRNRDDNLLHQQQPFIFKTSSDSCNNGGTVERSVSTDFGFLLEPEIKSKSELLFESFFGLSSESVSFYSSGFGSGLSSEPSALLGYDSRNSLESLSTNNDGSKYGLLGLLDVLRMTDKVRYC